MSRFAITEEPSRTGSGAPCMLFYVREVPFTPGYSIQTTALTREAAERTVRALTGGAR